MSLNKRLGPFKEMSFAKAADPYRVRFTAAGVTPCTGLVQDEGLVSSVTRTGAGTYVLHLRSRFMRIICVAPNVEKSGDWDAKVLSKVEGVTTANSITVEVNNVAVGVKDPSATVELGFWLISSADG